MTTIAVFNQKGGVGKSSTAQAISAGLQLRGKQTLLIDLDPQCNTTDTYVPNRPQISVYDVLRGADAKQAIMRTEFCDVICGSDALSYANVWTDPQGKLIKFAQNKDLRIILKSQLFYVKSSYDVCIIDCPPNIGLIALNALVAADAYIVPIESSPYGINALKLLKCTVDGIRELNPKLLNYGIIPCKHDSRTTVGKLMLEEIRTAAEELQTIAYDPVPVCSAIPNAQYCHMSIWKYDHNSKASQAYSRIIDELISVI